MDTVWIVQEWNTTLGHPTRQVVCRDLDAVRCYVAAQGVVERETPTANPREVWFEMQIEQPKYAKKQHFRRFIATQEIVLL